MGQPLNQCVIDVISVNWFWPGMPLSTEAFTSWAKRQQTITKHREHRNIWLVLLHLLKYLHTRGTTESINLRTHSFAKAFWQDGTKSYQWNGTPFKHCTMAVVRWRYVWWISTNVVNCTLMILKVKSTSARDWFLWLIFPTLGTGIQWRR